MGYIYNNVFHGSTLVADESATHWRFNGRTRSAISNRWLKSGIIPGRGTGPFHQTGPSLGILPGTRVFLTASYIENITQKKSSVNPRKGGAKVKKVAKLVYNKLQRVTVVQWLHNFVVISWFCYQIHNISCFTGNIFRIFCVKVYIKFMRFLLKKLSNYRVLRKRLDFLKIFVIMTWRSFVGLRFCYRLIPLLLAVRNSSNFAKGGSFPCKFLLPLF